MGLYHQRGAAGKRIDAETLRGAGPDMSLQVVLTAPVEASDGVALIASAYQTDGNEET